MKNITNYLCLLFIICMFAGCSKTDNIPSFNVSDTAVSGKSTRVFLTNRTEELKNTPVGAVMWPEIIYASNDIVVIRHKYLIKFSLSQRKIVDYMDMSPYELDKLQGSSTNTVIKVSPDGNIAYFEDEKDGMTKQFYTVNIAKKEVKKTTEEYMSSQTGVTVKDFDLNKFKLTHKYGSACFLPDSRVLGFWAVDKKNEKQADYTYSWWAFRLYDNNGNVLETIPLFNDEKESAPDLNKLRNMLGGGYYPEILYADEDTVTVRYNCLMKFSLSEKRIVDYMDLKPYKLDFQQGDPVAFVRNVSEDGNIIYFEKMNDEKTGKNAFYMADMKSDSVTEISEGDMPLQPSNLARECKTDNNGTKKCFLHDDRIVDFSIPEKDDSDAYSLDIYDAEGNLNERIILFSKAE